MSEIIYPAPPPPPTTTRSSEWSVQTISPGVVLAGVFLLVLAVAIAYPPLVTHFDPLTSDIAQTLQPPSAQHWIGTDRIGRDV